MRFNAATVSILLTISFFTALPTVEAKPPYVPSWPVRMQTEVLRIARSFQGEFAVYIKDLSTDVAYGFNAHTPMYLASGIKVPVMVAAMQGVESGRLKLNDTVEYRSSDVRDGTPLLNYLRPGASVTLGILLEIMIQQSDNAATDMVIRHVGIEAVNAAMTKEGITGFAPITSLIDVRRLVYDKLDPRTREFTPEQIFRIRMTRGHVQRLALISQFIGEKPGFIDPKAYPRAYAQYYADGYNSASMVAMAELLEGIVEGRVVSPKASKRMLDIMLGTKTGLRRLRAGLPSHLQLAHKTGTQFRRTNDFGVVFLEDGRPIVVVVSVKESRSRAHDERFMAKIAELTYQNLSQGRAKNTSCVGCAKTFGTALNSKRKFTKSP